MTYLHNLLLFQNIHFYIDPLLKYDEDGYPIEEDELDEDGYPIEEDLDDLYDDDLIPEKDKLEE